MEKKYKIAILGAESTGKTTLCQVLVKKYNLLFFVPEFARSYLHNKGSHYYYTEADLLYIAENQQVIENFFFEHTTDRFLFCDTTLLTIQIWSEYKYGYCADTIKKRVRENKYDFFFITESDFPWEPDPLRENPYMREGINDTYKRTLTDMGFSYHSLYGSIEERLHKVSQVINHIL
ncbi:MAG: ATP-binding protein [Chitinophagaceae bacterium]|nr:ATP-binding protein [Chitinophagaceae bacterium]